MISDTPNGTKGNMEMAVNTNDNLDNNNNNNNTDIDNNNNINGEEEKNNNSNNNNDDIENQKQIVFGSATHENEDLNCFMRLYVSIQNKLNEDPPPDYKLIILVWVSRIIPIFAAFFAVVYIIYLIAVSDNWITDPNSEDADILKRETNRGLFVSICIAILLNCMGAFMFYIKVRESLVVTNYGFILGPVVGFMLDQAIGTDAGFKDFMTIAGFSYTFSSLIGGNFMRYIVTVFLDLFISNPLQDVLKTQVAKVGVIRVLKENCVIGVPSKPKPVYLNKYDNFVAMNYPSILQSIVAFVTFNAYTNQTRFAWAYPALTLDRELRIPPGTIMLSTAIAGILYLNFYTIMDYISERQYFDVNTKLLYVIAILGLLYGLNFTDSIEAPVEGEYDKEYTKSITSAKPYLGIMMFTAFVLYGFAYPIYTRLGCCGYWKPTEKELKDDIDHIAEADEDELKPLHIQKEMLKNDVKIQLKEEIINEIDKKN